MAAAAPGETETRTSRRETPKVGFKIQVWDDEGLSPVFRPWGEARRGHGARSMSAGGPGVWSPLHRQWGCGGLRGDPETRRDPDPAVGQAHAPQTGLIRGCSGERTCTERPSAAVSGRGLAARDEGLRCPGDSGTWGARSPTPGCACLAASLPGAGSPSPHARRVGGESRLHRGLRLEAWRGTGVRADSGHSLCG